MNNANIEELPDPVCNVCRNKKKNQNVRSTRQNCDEIYKIEYETHDLPQYIINVKITSF